MVSSTTFISDTVKWLRNSLIANISDPVTHSGDEKFVMTSYPRRPVRYPIITVRCIGTPINKNIGIGTEIHIASMQMEVRIWARNEVERDALTEQVFNFLRTNQYPAGTTNTSTQQELWNFSITSSVPVDEMNGTQPIKSQVISVQYDFFVGGN